MTEAEKKYADIINLPRHTSPNRPRMSAIDRAAQFSPFAALTGYEDAVSEAGRLTDQKLLLSEDAKTVINEKIQLILDVLNEEPIVAITHFVPDPKKSGGSYETVSGIIKEINEYDRAVILTDNTFIPIEQIREIESPLFRCYE